MVDDRIRARIDELGELNDALIRANETVAKLKNRIAGAEDELRPLLDELRATNTRVLQGTKYTVAVVKYGYEAKSPSYKAAFELALTKVNSKIRAILENSLAETTSIKRVLSKIATQPITESFGSKFTKLLMTLRAFVKRAVVKIRRSRLEYEQEFKNLNKLLKQM